MAAWSYNAIMDDLLGRKPADARRQAKAYVGRFIAGQSAVSFLGPQLAALTEAEMNWSNFRQQHIVSPWLVDLPASEQYHAKTPEFYKALGRWMDYSPAKIEYIVNQGISRQVNDTVRLLNRIEAGKPLDELADIPYVGRLFIRNPEGFGTASVQEMSEIDKGLKALDARMNAKGLGWLKTVPPEALTSPELAALRQQLDYLEGLREARNAITVLSKLARLANKGENADGATRAQADMVKISQAALADNPQARELIQTVLELERAAPEMSPEIQAADYEQRAFKGGY